MKTHKGCYGYLKRKRRQTLLIVIVMMAAAFGMYFGALHYFGTNQNWFTIFAVLICLPAARFIVNLVMLFRAKGCSEAAHAEIEKTRAQTDNTAYDLYMTSEKKNFDLSHAAWGSHCVIALTEDPKCDINAGEQHIRRIMQSNGFHGYTVKIFTSLKNYCARLDQLATQQDQTGEEKEAELRALLLQISL